MRRNRLLIISILLGFNLMITGCEQGSEASRKPTPDNTAGQQQSAGKQDAFTITSNSAGVVQLGMTLNEVLAVIPDATSKTTQDGEGIEWTDINIKDETAMSVLLNDDQTISLIRVFSPAFSTEQGVRVGDNIQQAADKLGGLSEIQSTEIESREFATFKNASSNVEFQVVGKDDASAGVYASGDTSTSIASPTATIQSIWVVED